MSLNFFCVSVTRLYFRKVRIIITEERNKLATTKIM